MGDKNGQPEACEIHHEDRPGYAGRSEPISAGRTLVSRMGHLEVLSTASRFLKVIIPPTKMLLSLEITEHEWRTDLSARIRSKQQINDNVSYQDQVNHLSNIT